MIIKMINMEWFYFIDKPLKYSSFDIIRVLRKKINIKKIGHTGTLDPLASGGLLIAVWNYTKLISYLEKDVKEYEFTVNFDWETESFDLWTDVEYFSEEIINKFKSEISLEKIEGILKKYFTWKIKQVAPKYSAKKINWQRAYSLARAWKDFEMKANDVEILNIEIVDYTFPELKLKAKVSAWTYIRSIAYDLAVKLWLEWSYVSYLRRTSIDNLNVSEAQKLDDFNVNNILDIKKVLSNRTFITLDREIQVKIDNWLKIKWNFDYIIWEDLFVEKDWIITNIIEYNGNELVPKRKI
jgi:tRNA pseudouridine55 synthase